MSMCWRKSRLLVWLALASLSVALLGAGCGKGTGQGAAGGGPPEVKIGHIHPLTGSMAYEGGLMRSAIQMCVDEINESGGIKSLGGAKIKLLDGDSQGLPEKAASEAERMIREGAVALLGTYNSSTAYTATQIAEKEKVPFVITVAVADDILERGFKYTFRIQPRATVMAQNFISYLKQIKTDDIETIGLIHEETLFGTSIAKYIEQHAAEAGVKVVANIAYSPKAADLTAEVNKLKGANPDVVVATSYFQDGCLLAKTLSERGVRGKALIGVANGAFSDPKFAATVGEKVAEGVIDINYRANPKSELTQKVLARFQEKYGQKLSSHAVYAYMAMRVVADALERCGSTDPVKLREALAASSITDHILPQGPIEFDERGENVNAQAVMIQVQKGLPVVVLPEEYAEAKLIFPLR